LAMHDDRRLVGIPGLVIDLSGGAAVDRVSIFSAKTFDIELFGPISHFFVRGKRDPDRPMLYGGIAQKRLDDRQNLGAARFIISSEKGGAVGSDNIGPGIAFEVRIFFDGDDLARIARKNNISSLIVF